MAKYSATFKLEDGKEIDHHTIDVDLDGIRVGDDFSLRSDHWSGSTHYIVTKIERNYWDDKPNSFPKLTITVEPERKSD